MRGNEGDWGNGVFAKKDKVPVTLLVRVLQQTQPYVAHDEARVNALKVEVKTLKTLKRKQANQPEKHQNSLRNAMARFNK